MHEDVITLGGLQIRYLVDGSKTGGLGAFELTVAPGANVPPPHSHKHNDELVYGLEGTLGYSVDGLARELTAGQCMLSPRGSVHSFRNTGTTTARALIVMAPDIGEQYFLDVAAITNVGGPPDRARLMDVMSRYGLVPAPPPQPTTSSPALKAGA
jgi:quercetin dioxygenase-like cupin family protein